MPLFRDAVMTTTTTIEKTGLHLVGSTLPVLITARGQPVSQLSSSLIAVKLKFSARDRSALHKSLVQIALRNCSVIPSLKMIFLSSCDLIFFFFFLLIFVCHQDHVRGANWSYDDKSPVGPPNWGNSYGNCKKDRQSPVDIVEDKCVPFKPPKFVFGGGYDATDGGHKLVNNGHTIQLTMGTQNKNLSGGDLGATYRLVQMHMHWGSADKAGSEHLLNGKSYPLEIHLVHHNEAFPTIEAAMTEENGLAVLGVFAEVGAKEHGQLQTIIKSLTSVKYADTTVDFKEKIKIFDLLPEDKDNFFRYSGSLTTPPCHESVIWTVFRKPITISQNQIHELRKVLHGKLGEHEAPLVNNYRPVQNLNARSVKMAQTKGTSASGRIVHMPLAFILPMLFSSGWMR